jgi:hypothetical protein
MVDGADLRGDDANAAVVDARENELGGAGIRSKALSRAEWRADQKELTIYRERAETQLIAWVKQ